jgi:hypothetical protein
MDEQAVELTRVAPQQPGLQELCVKTAVAHTITYFLMGVIASTTMNYKEAFTRPEIACYMRQVSDPWVMAGPLFQPLRGLIFALAFYPIRGAWQKTRLAGDVVAVGGTGNSEYIRARLGIGRGNDLYAAAGAGADERMAGSGAAGIVVVDHSVLLGGAFPKKWMNWMLGIIFFLTMALPVMGLMMKR